jgi:hypothetical protein
MKRKGIAAGAILTTLVIVGLLWIQAHVADREAAPPAPSSPVSMPNDDHAAPPRIQTPVEQSDSRTKADEGEGPDAEWEVEVNKLFEAEALQTFPLHTVQTHDPNLPPKAAGPPRGEVWIRIKPEHAAEMRDIMDRVADLYREVTAYEEPLTVMHWVGNRPHARLQYPPQERQE